MPSVQHETPKTLYDKIYEAHLIADDTIYIDRWVDFALRSERVTADLSRWH